MGLRVAPAGRALTRHDAQGAHNHQPSTGATKLPSLSCAMTGRGRPGKTAWAVDSRAAPAAHSRPHGVHPDDRRARVRGAPRARRLLRLRGGPDAQPRRDAPVGQHVRVPELQLVAAAAERRGPGATATTRSVSTWLCVSLSRTSFRPAATMRTPSAARTSWCVTASRCTSEATPSFRDYLSYPAGGGGKDMGAGHGSPPGTFTLEVLDVATGRVAWRATAPAVFKHGPGRIRLSPRPPR